jgi:DNA-binding CsgD family transcriptional regulator
MINLNQIKITPRDQQALRLLVQGCNRKEIVRAILIPSPRTVKQHLRILFLHAGIKRRPEAREARHRDVHQGVGASMQPRDRLIAKEIQIATFVWQGLNQTKMLPGYCSRASRW